jgi:hypothetical protein
MDLLFRLIAWNSRVFPREYFLLHLPIAGFFLAADMIYVLICQSFATGPLWK